MEDLAQRNWDTRPSAFKENLEMTWEKIVCASLFLRKISDEEVIIKDHYNQVKMTPQQSVFFLFFWQYYVSQHAIKN